jgi:hypothetical protein
MFPPVKPKPEHGNDTFNGKTKGQTSQKNNGPMRRGNIPEVLNDLVHADTLDYKVKDYSVMTNGFLGHGNHFQEPRRGVIPVMKRINQ